MTEHIDEVYLYIEISPHFKLDSQTTLLPTTSGTVNKTASQSMVTQPPDLTTTVGTVVQSTVTLPPGTTTGNKTQGTVIQESVSQQASVTQQSATLINATNIQSKTNLRFNPS